MKKYLFFKDKKPCSGEGNLIYGAAGIVEKVFNEQGAVSGKDLSVLYFDSFTGYYSREWRAYSDVDLYEVNEFQYNFLLERYNLLDKKKPILLDFQKWFEAKGTNNIPSEKEGIEIKAWISVKENMPDSGSMVLVFGRNENKKGRVIRAFHANRFQIQDDNELEAAEYSEEKDEYYLKEGWYESNEFDEVNWFVELDVTHWMYLPDFPFS